MTENEEDTQPWMQQKGEQSKSFYHFTIYRDLGASRTIESVIDKIKEIVRECKENPDTPIEDIPKIPTLSALVGLSARWNWVSRCQDWDEHLDKIARTEKEKEIKSMAERHATDSRNLQEKVLKVIEDPNFEEEPLTKRAWILNTTVHSHYKEVSLERLSVMGESINESSDEDITTSNTAEEVEDLFREAERGNTDDD